MGRIQCTQTGGESIAISCLCTDSPRAQNLFRRGQQQQHLGISGLRRPCSLSFKPIGTWSRSTSSSLASTKKERLQVGNTAAKLTDEKEKTDVENLLTQPMLVNCGTGFVSQLCPSHLVASQRKRSACTSQRFSLLLTVGHVFGSYLIFYDGNDNKWQKNGGKPEISPADVLLLCDPHFASQILASHPMFRYKGESFKIKDFRVYF